MPGGDYVGDLITSCFPAGYAFSQLHARSMQKVNTNAPILAMLRSGS